MDIFTSYFEPAFSWLAMTADGPDALVEIQMDVKIIWKYAPNTVLYVTVVVAEYIFTIHKWEVTFQTNDRLGEVL